MISPIRFVNKEEEVRNLNKFSYSRGTLICVHIADIHFGALDPKYQYDILKEQFLNKISNINFDVLCINGDLFDHKFMSNSDAVLYATIFINECIKICSDKNAVCILLAGTEEHDAGQLKLFYHYLTNKNIDIRIVEYARFEFVKGAKILCLPEEYGKGEDYYNHFLINSGHYDLCIMHGMFEGAVYQDKIKNIESDRAPVFNMDNFINCKGCIVAGHVHTPGCFNGYFYYTGSPYTWRFGEEHDKGFLITLHNLDTSEHFVHFEIIESSKYITINLDDMINSNPDEIIKYINDYKQKNNIDYLRLEILKVPKEEYLGNIEIIKKYFRNNNTIKIKNEMHKQQDIIEQNNNFLDEYQEFEFILDTSLSEHEILTKYINTVKGYVYITVEELIDILKE